MSGDDRAFTLTAAYRNALAKHADSTAVETPEEAVTYRELDRRSNAVATALRDRGVGVEDRVALLMGNRIEYVVAYLGLVKAGATEVPLNEMLTREEFAYMLADAGAGTVFVGSEFHDDVAALAPDLPELSRLVAVGGGAPEAFEPYADLLADGDRETAPAVSVSPDDAVRHAYTGGTTGKPKGVVHAHASRSANLYSTVLELGITDADTLLLTTPLPHSAGTFLTAAILAGARSLVRTEFDPETAMRTVEEESVTWAFMVPTMIYRLLDSPALEAYDASTLENVVYGAAPMTPARLREGIDRFGPVFTQFYGQTEVPNLITSLTRTDHRVALAEDREDRLSSAGTPAVMVDVKIADPDTGERLPRGEIGEIAVTGPYTLTAYHERPEATAETIRDGWVFTGDVGRRDEAGYVYLLDRKNDMIVTGGLNVYSIEVEEALDEHPAVREVAVIGVPDEEWGEAVTAVVVPHADGDVDEATLRRFADDRLAAYKKPKRVDVVEEIPTTPYGKVDKKALRSGYWDEDDERQVS